MPGGERESLGLVALVSTLSAMPIAFLTFNSMFPNVTTPSLESNMLLVFLLSILVAVPVGYFIRKPDMAIVCVFLYTLIGYMLALVLYSMPYLFYDVRLVLPSFYYLIFFRFTFILVFIYILGGFVGVVLGQVMRDSVGGEATRLTWSER